MNKTGINVTDAVRWVYFDAEIGHEYTVNVYDFGYDSSVYGSVISDVEAYEADKETGIDLSVIDYGNPGVYSLSVVITGKVYIKITGYDSDYENELFGISVADDSPVITPVSLGEWIEGDVSDTSESIWYTFEARDGEKYDIEWKEDEAVYNASIGLYVYKADRVNEYMSYDTTSPASFTATETGTVFVEVNGYSEGKFAICVKDSLTLSGFLFEAADNTGFEKDIFASVDGTDITVIVPTGVDVTGLVATFEASTATVKVGSTTQISGTTVNDFSSPVTYTITGSSGFTRDYTVTVVVAENTFWATDSTKEYTSTFDGWYQVFATNKGSGTHCEVFVEYGAEVAQTTINSIISEFDGKIWTTVTANFAAPTDVDANSKVKLLLLDIKDGYVSGGSYVGGYFFGVDLYEQADLSAAGFPAHYKSNEAELLYIDINPNDPTSTDFRSTIAHEFQHLVNTGQNRITEDSDPMPTWIDEGFAMAAELIYQEVDILESREAWYNADPLYTGAGGVTKNESCSLAYGWPLVCWANDDTIVLNNYALSHLFFAWLRIHKNAAGDDDTFFNNIIMDTDNTFAAVVTECDSLGAEVDTEEKMIQMFYLANYLGGNGKTTGLASYLGLNEHTGPFVFTSPGTDIPIYQGGAVHFYSADYDNWSPSGGDATIVYALANNSAQTYDIAAPYGSGIVANEVLVVVNAESDGSSPAASNTAVLPSMGFVSSSNLMMMSQQKTNLASKPKAVKLPKEAFRIGLEKR